MKNTLSERDANRLYAKMREKGISTSQLCKALNVHYQCFIAMTEGRQPCYKGWKKIIAEILQTDKEELFPETI